MPREWYDVHSALEIPDEEMRELYLSILADKKPYFMRYIYPDLMKEYNTYIKNTEKKAQREFSLSTSELLSKDEAELTEREREFLRYYKRGIPVGMGDCLMNRICRRFEEEFDGCLARLRLNSNYDYGILKQGVDYPASKYYKIKKLYDEYSTRVRDYAAYVQRERVDSDTTLAHNMAMRDEFRRLCASEVSNGTELCEIVIDMCYKSGGTKSFAWGMCGSGIIDGLLSKNNGEISYPVVDECGEIEFGGRRFSFHTKKIG